MKFRWQTFAAFFCALILAAAATAADKPQTFSGVVGDAMCGTEHMMDGSAADCTRQCIAKGSKYALIVGTKVYTLETTDKDVLSSLDKNAGAPVKVTGTLSGENIAVKTVVGGK